MICCDVVKLAMFWIKSGPFVWKKMSNDLNVGNDRVDVYKLLYRFHGEQNVSLLSFVVMLPLRNQIISLRLPLNLLALREGGNLISGR